MAREWPGLDRNPFAKAGKLYRSDRSDKVWSAEQIRALLAVAPRHIALPFLLAVCTGQRQGDLLVLPWRQYDGTRIMLRQRTTKRHVSVKLAGPVKDALDVPRAALGEPPAPEIATMTGHSLADVQSIPDKNCFRRDARLLDAGVDKMDAMLSAMAAVANDVAIGAARKSRHPNGVVGHKRQARGKNAEAA